MLPKSKNPTATEWGQWRSWAARQGISQAVVKQLFGNKHDDFSRDQAAQRLAEYARSL